MKAKDYLKQLEMLDIKINQKIKQASDLREITAAGKGIDYSKDKVQTCVSSDALSENVIRYISLENEINRRIDEFVDLKNQIINQIQELKDANHMQILYKRYVEYKRLEVIAVEMNYTYPYIRTLHGHALQDFERTYTILH